MKKYGYFDSASYNTPEKGRKTLFDRIINCNRLYFTLKYAVIVFRTRKQAMRGKYDTKAWADSSFYIFRFIEKAGGVFSITVWRISAAIRVRSFSLAII
jgi:hypothetical protein